MRRAVVWLVVVLLVTACAPATPPVIPTPSSIPPPTATEVVVPRLWIGEAAPARLREYALSAGLPTAATPETGTVTLDVVGGVESNAPIENPDLPSAEWTYALVAPFPTLVDEVTLVQLRRAWEGEAPDPFVGSPLFMNDSTLAAFSSVWGRPADGAVKALPSDELLDAAWVAMPAWAIVPFEDLEPRWKVLAVDGQSPARNDFDALGYPLSLRFQVRAASAALAAPLQHGWPATNRDPRKLTTLLMTGVTALVRFTAITMNTKGVLYPGRDIRTWLRDADIAHISNEVPFWGGCQPTREPGRLIFCSDPSYIRLLEDIGADVIELSGDHFGDYGPSATTLTIEMYSERGMGYYGGGLDLEDAAEPLFVEHNGNKLAFFGCNAKGRGGALAFATERKPGAYPCDLSHMATQVREAVSAGYVVVASFQWHESQTYSPLPFVTQISDFHRMADAGASVISGSQAHSPQTMEFSDGAFIHYGLGNLFFDQMGDLSGQPESVRDEFLDRYTVYDGRLVSIELLTAKLEDYSRPRPMTPDERWEFLAGMFTLSGWTAQPTRPSPVPTVTLTPIRLPTGVGTPPAP